MIIHLLKILNRNPQIVQLILSCLRQQGCLKVYLSLSQRIIIYNWQNVNSLLFLFTGRKKKKKAVILELRLTVHDSNLVWYQYHYKHFITEANQINSKRSNLRLNLQRMKIYKWYGNSMQSFLALLTFRRKKKKKKNLWNISFHHQMSLAFAL